MELAAEFEMLFAQLAGSGHQDDLHLMMYATDASVYRQRPLAVIYPKNDSDVQKTLKWCSDHGISLTPRAAGTSLAGQCVSNGVVVDVSKHMNQILSFDQKGKTITVQPGVVRDDLNRFLAPHGLFFGPNTSTSSRCTIGGMVGNNSSGTTSIKYGVTRDKLVGLSGFMVDGTPVHFGLETQSDSPQKMSNATDNEWVEGGQEPIEHAADLKAVKSLKAAIFHELMDPVVREEIKSAYPHASIHRRNTGYALDLLADQWHEFHASGPRNKTQTPISAEDLNLLPLICGSEGTLMFSTAITLKLDVLPPSHNALVVLQYRELNDCMNDVVTAMNHDLYTCELMDDVVLDCTKSNALYNSYRFFVKDEPKAVLFCELRDEDQAGLKAQVDSILSDLKAQKRAYDLQVLYGEDIEKAIKLRTAGLGLLGAMVGDKKAVACIEDTAVDLQDLPEFIREFSAIMDEFNQKSVYYAHAGAGELHLRPILNLKDTADVQDFRAITTAVSALVKKYRGSLSGEHGDGIVRSEFIIEQIGEQNYARLKNIKSVFDPQGLMNPGKIVDPWSMDERLRAHQTKSTPAVKTKYDFSKEEGILRLSEQCNGSGDCRNSHEHGGMLCPSYQATKNERDTTRARANVLREVLSSRTTDAERWSSEALAQAFDLCVGCKACHNECPSKVDMATVKSELLFQRRKQGLSKGHDWFFGHSSLHYRTLMRLPSWIRGVVNTSFIGGLVKKKYQIAPQRSLPKFPRRSFTQTIIKNGWRRRQPHSFYLPSLLDPSGKPKQSADQPAKRLGRVYLWVDEFSDYLEPEIALDAQKLLSSLGYELECITGLNSARALLSKGYLDRAKSIIDNNLSYFEHHCQDGPVLGIEPSALYGLRDEYIRLASDQVLAQKISQKAQLVEEFLVQQMRQGLISEAQFSHEPLTLKLHLHCHQKSLGSVKDTFDLLNFPKGYSPRLIPSGCCGMAGSFGFEKQHYSVSQKMAELQLLPAVRRAEKDTVIVANGTSCRHQIRDGAHKTAVHPITALRWALRS